MRIKYYGMLFDYTEALEVQKKNIELDAGYVAQEINNFVLVNYYKREKKYWAIDDNGFQTIKKQLFIELYMTDTNPRKLLYDKKDDMVYRISDMPIGQTFEPDRRRLYELPIEVIETAKFTMRLNMDFIRSKYDELWEVYNATV